MVQSSPNRTPQKGRHLPGVISSPLGLARVRLHLLTNGKVEYKTLQESLAIEALRKQERIELYRTIAVVTATVNPEKAQAALQNLIEETFPEVAKDREKSIEKAMEIMEKERQRTYSVSSADQAMKKGSWSKFRDILKQKRSPRRPG